MFNIEDIKTELVNLVGFRAEEGIPLPSTLTASTSSLFVNDHHPLLRLSTLDAVRPSDLTLEDFLLSMRDNAVVKLINDVFTHKQMGESVKENLITTPIFDSGTSIKNLETPRGRFVGFAIRMSRTYNLATTIKRITLQLLENQELTLHLKHSSQLGQSIETKTVNYTNSKRAQFFDLGWLLKYTTEDTDFGGVYYLGYYEDDLIEGNRAVYKDHNITKRPCGGCSRYNLTYYNKWSPYMSLSNIYVPATKLDGSGGFDIKDIGFVERNFGMNFEVEFRCDITDFILENTRALVYPLLDRLGIDLLRYVEMSPTRNNRITDEMAKESYVAINGVVSENNFVKARGMMHDYMDKIKGLSFEYSRLDPVCLPCDRKGLKWNKRSLM
jgi:hypothetical protein